MTNAFASIRPDLRRADQVRPVTVSYDIAPEALGSVLISYGNTRVICACSVEESVPPWMRAQNKPGGWLTAEYSLLPYSTTPRSRRETQKPSGRTMEIQRLIGRSIRASVDMLALGPRTLCLDCDVLQADGGTRTASVTGAWLALNQAVTKLLSNGQLKRNPIISRIAAVSVGVVKGQSLLDLCYLEDVDAEVDMNIVMSGDGKFVEVQGTAETSPFSGEHLQTMLSLAQKGIADIIAQCPALPSAP